jgi:predicted transcriptional regulator YheO
MNKDNNMNMSVLQPVTEKMKSIIPTLPQDWAERVAEKLDISKEVVYQHVRGDRGKRNKKRVLDILRVMIEIKKEFMAEIAELTEK